DHAARAVAAAREIVEFAEQASDDGLGGPVRAGCGISSGEMVLGIVGSDARSELTVMGDAVNVASRLCAQAAPGQVLVTEATAEALERDGCISVGWSLLKHHRQPVATYSATPPPQVTTSMLLSASSSSPEAFSEFVESAFGAISTHIDGSPWVLLADAAGRYIDASPAALSALGYSAAELREMSVADVTVADAEWTAAEWDRYRTHGQWEGEVGVRRKDGTTQRVTAHARVIQVADGTVHASLLTPA
ncbi:MAG: PAS domain S-box protein, partial [Chloroflexi bacterium]|nr:PAS domain S-box protein [Chloroflexota bacterium]